MLVKAGVLESTLSLFDLKPTFNYNYLIRPIPFDPFVLKRAPFNSSERLLKEQRVIRKEFLLDTFDKINLINIQSLLKCIIIRVLKMKNTSTLFVFPIILLSYNNIK